jgi:hypothetical protein|tara:strand:- start:2316 stop:2594 length:279 start_codon:yes stop_codon:yes gene_type:complete
MSKCQHCSEPNPENWFNCRSCGQKASPQRYTVNSIIRDTPMATAIRKDQINFGRVDMESHMKKTKANNDKLAKDKLHKSVAKIWKKDKVTVK